jgi:hypothetical protein
MAAPGWFSMIAAPSTVAAIRKALEKADSELTNGKRPEVRL